jgi:hypothetical protein
VESSCEFGIEPSGSMKCWGVSQSLKRRGSSVGIATGSIAGGVKTFTFFTALGLTQPHI